jgi:hypothetical protein
MAPLVIRSLPHCQVEQCTEMGKVAASLMIRRRNF